MSALRRAEIRRLATAAFEMELSTMDGILTRDGDGRWRIGRRQLETWLDQHEGVEIVLILGSLADEKPLQQRSCTTCGRDFTGHSCPHCRQNRLRLRGRGNM